jgi:hypothetical protein
MMAEPSVQVAFGQVNPSIARSFPTPKSSSSGRSLMLPLPLFHIYLHVNIYKAIYHLFFKLNKRR